MQHQNKCKKTYDSHDAFLRRQSLPYVFPSLPHTGLYTFVQGLKEIMFFAELQQERVNKYL